MIFTLLLQLLQPLGTWRMVIMPLLLVLLMLFRPSGILGLRELRDAGAAARARRRHLG